MQTGTTRYGPKNEWLHRYDNNGYNDNNIQTLHKEYMPSQFNATNYTSQIPQQPTSPLNKRQLERSTVFQGSTNGIYNEYKRDRDYPSRISSSHLGSRDGHTKLHKGKKKVRFDVPGEMPYERMPQRTPGRGNQMSYEFTKKTAGWYVQRHNSLYHIYIYNTLTNNKLTKTK